VRRKVATVARPAAELLTFDAGQVFMVSTPDVERWAPSEAPLDGWRATRAWGCEGQRGPRGLRMVAHGSAGRGNARCRRTRAGLMSRGTVRSDAAGSQPADRFTFSSESNWRTSVSISSRTGRTAARG
jgi:hypothetical protein